MHCAHRSTKYASTVIPAMVQRLRFSINVQRSLKFTQISVNVA